MQGSVSAECRGDHVVLWEHLNEIGKAPLTRATINRSCDSDSRKRPKHK